MTRGIVAGLALLCAARGTADELTSERYPDADTVIVDDRIETVYQADGTYVTTDEEWVKALTEKGRRALSTISLDYSLRYGKGEIVLVEIIGADGKARAVDFAKTLKEATDNSASSMNIYDPLDKTLSCAVPGLKVGETRHVITRREATKSRVKDQWADIDLFESTDPIVRTSVKIDGPLSRPLRNIAVRHPLGNMESSVVTNGERVVYTWTAKDSPQMFPEPSMPPFWTQGQHLRVSTAESWPQLSKWYWELSLPHLEKTNAAMSNKVEEIVRATNRDTQAASLDLVKAIYKFVSQEVRYMGLTMEDTSPGYAPHDVSLTFDNRYGVCRDKAALLVAMLRMAGIDAWPVLINVGPRKDPDVPQPYFNHAIVAADSGDPADPYLLMDPTSETTRSLLPEYLCEMSYLVARDEGEGIRETPPLPVEQNLLRAETVYTLHADASADVTTTLSFAGVNDAAYRGYFASISRDAIRAFFERLLAGIPGAVLTGWEVRPAPEALRTSPEPLSVRLDYAIAEAARGAEDGRAALLDLPTVPAALAIASRVVGDLGLEKRRFPLVTDYPCGWEETVEIRLPDGVTLSPESAAERQPE